MARFVTSLHLSFDCIDELTILLFPLLLTGQYDAAAAATPKILGINAKLWEDWVFLFADKGKLDVSVSRFRVARASQN